MKDILNLLEISKSDINSSLVLYENKLHSQSYFYFQQASEKANKALWLLLGLYNKHELSKIGHNQIKPLRKSAFNLETQITELESFDKNLTILSEHPLMRELDIELYRKKLKSSVKHLDNLHQYDLLRIEEKELDSLLEFLKEFEDFDFKLPSNFDKKFKDLIIEQANWLDKFNTVDENLSKNLREILQDDTKYNIYMKDCIEYWELTLKLMSSQFCLMFCSLLTNQHCSSTRYPDYERGGTNPLTIYTESLPIVKKQKIFLEYLEKTVSKIIKISNSFEIKEVNKTDKSVSKEKHKIINPVADTSWEIFGVKDKRDFIEKFLINKNCHNKVPAQIQKELTYAEYLQSHSYYFYPMYSDAFSRLTRVFEMAIETRAKQFGINTNNKTLNGLINLISKNYQKDFVTHLQWARKMRNYNAHPEMTTMYGSILRLPILRITNIINDVFRKKEFFEENNNMLNKLKLEYKDFENGLWVLGNYLVHSIQPISIRGNLVLWLFIPVHSKYPQSYKEIFSPVPHFAYLKTYMKEGKNFIGLNWNDEPLKLNYTDNKEDILSYNNYKEQSKSSPSEVRHIVNTTYSNNVYFIEQEFIHQTNDIIT